MKNEKKLSIVIPTFNQGSYIERCLKSILDQTYKNIEVIIQDALSSDSTEKICHEYQKKDSRIHYFREKDKGQSDALNKGLHKSTGYFWTWICSDDMYLSNNAIEDLINHYHALSENDKNKTAGIYGNAFYIDEQDNRIGFYHNKNFDLNLFHFQFDWPLSQPSLILKRDDVIRAKGIDSRLYLGMDLDLFIKILKKGKIFKFYPTEVAGVRIQENSKSVKLRTQTAENAIQLVRNHFGYIGTKESSAFIRELASAAGEEHAFKYTSQKKLQPKVSYKINHFLQRVKNAGRRRILNKLRF